MEKFLITIAPLDPDSATPRITAIATPVDPDLKPEHPIVIPPEPSPPLVIWGPNDPRPTPPIYIPIQKPDEPQPPLVIWGPTDPRPTPPIFIPPQPAPPLVIWGPPGPWITPPIYLPPQVPGEPPVPPIVDWDPCKPRPSHPIYIPPQIPSGARNNVVVMGAEGPQLDKLFPPEDS